MEIDGFVPVGAVNYDIRQDCRDRKGSPGVVKGNSAENVHHGCNHDRGLVEYFSGQGTNEESIHRVKGCFPYQAGDSGVVFSSKGTNYDEMCVHFMKVGCGGEITLRNFF